MILKTILKIKINKKYMKQFVGKINGTEYNNEKDFINALKNLSSCENLSISSFYKETSDNKEASDNKEVSDNKENFKDINVKSLIPNEKFEVPIEFTNNINKVSSKNFKEVKTFIQNQMNEWKEKLDTLNKDSLDLLQKYNKIKELTAENDDKVRNATDNYNYYNKLNSFVTITPAITCDDKVNENKSINEKDMSVYDVFDIVNDFSKFLNEVGFWKK